MGTIRFPDWAEEMRQIFRADTISQFVLHGNINDCVPHDPEKGTAGFLPLRDYLATVLFSPFDTVLAYDRGRGIVALKGRDYFTKFLSIVDKYHGSRWSSDGGAGLNPELALSMPGLLPRTPMQALDLIDRFVRTVCSTGRNPTAVAGRSVAVILDYAHFLFPASESLYLSGDIGSQLITVLNWAQDPTLTGARAVTCLLAENLLDLNQQVVENSYTAKIRVPLPDAAGIAEYVSVITKKETDFPSRCELEVPALATRLVGLTRVNVNNLLLRALRNNQNITVKYLTRVRKEIIEKEAAGKLEFMETKRTLDDVAGHEEAKRWLREDARLLRQSATTALPMGYLITGRIGTGKTYLVQCFAGECGVPFVEIKNFRDKWVGATEGNLEKIFGILHALGQVVVFVDEADQATGKRDSGDGDSGLSGRIYAMLAKEMADTDNRGKIIWIFATSRPDLVEVDLKRQGRLDVHIPLFPPENPKEIAGLFLAMARKLKIDIAESDLPTLTFTSPVGGNELEGLLVRAVRVHALQLPESPKKSFPEVLAEVARQFKPSAHTARLELMDLLAVKECTDTCFLPERFASLGPEEVETGIRRLRG